MNKSEKIRDLIRDRRTNIPTMPLIVEKILNIARDNRSSAKDLSNVIVKDQAISNKVLRIANSAYYGLMKNVDSVSRAITILGFNEVTSLTIGMSVFSSFSKNSVFGLLDMKDLWLHSIGTGMASRKIMERSGSGTGEQAFMGGLLHDIGKVVFAMHFPQEYRSVLEYAGESKIPLHLKEDEVMGIDHAELTGLLMERWHFPDSIMLPCRFHHNSGRCPINYQYSAMAVQFGDFLCQAAEIGHSGNQVPPEVTEVRDKLGISAEEGQKMVERLKKQRPSVEEFFQAIG